jgi:two-component system, NtrC family, sensor histidine kinase HydH
MVRRPDALSRHRGLVREAPRIAALFGIVAAIGLLHTTTHEPEAIWVGLLLRLYYIPILISAYWYGAFGGLLVAVVSSMAYAPHLRESPALEQGRFAEIVFFHVIGLSVGLLATAQRRVADRYLRAATTLEQANQELKSSYEQLQRADRLKTLGEVAAGLAHEIRHPLASIRGALEIIDSRSAPDSPEVEFSHLAMAEVERLDMLVWEFLRYARPHEPELRPTSLADVIDRVRGVLAGEADRAAVGLRVDRRDGDHRVTLDAAQIEQVLLNVVLNAIQASPRGSLVQIVHRVQHERVIVDVLDSGAGMSRDQAAQAFAPFFTTKDTGTGLGLAVAQRIVLAHQGSIEIASNPGHGTCVRIALPIRPPVSIAAATVTAETLA